MKVPAKILMNEAPIEGVSKKSGKPYKIYKLVITWNEELSTGTHTHWLNANCMQKLNEEKIKDIRHTENLVPVHIWFDLRESVNEAGKFYNDIMVTLPKEYLC